jgi:transcriptional regulator with XRE-family HTH domain
MAFSAQLKRLRLKSGDSLQEVADAVGLSKAHVWELETGKSSNPTKEVLEKLADHFKVPVAELIGETADVEDAQLAMMFRQLRDIDPKDRPHLQALIDSLRKRKKGR